MDVSFCDELWNKTLSAIARGHRAIMIWGFNEISIELLLRLNTKGLVKLVSGIVDPDMRFIDMPIGDFKVLSPDALKEMNIDTLLITEDERKEQVLRDFSKNDNRMPLVIIAGIKHLEFQNDIFDTLLSSCLVQSRAWGYPHMLIHIFQCLQHIAERKMNGNVAEFGVYKGGTTVFIAKTLLKFGIQAKIFAFDTFGGFPNRKSVLDLYNDPHDVYEDFESVRNYCGQFNIKLIQGDISETYKTIGTEPLILSFFDTDNYSPTRAAFELCYQQTVPGGFIACDHYYCDARWIDTIGERMAIEELLKDKKLLNLHGTGIFIKI